MKELTFLCFFYKQEVHIYFKQWIYFHKSLFLDFFV